VFDNGSDKGHSGLVSYLLLWQRAEVVGGVKELGEMIISLE